MKVYKYISIQSLCQAYKGFLNIFGEGSFLKFIYNLYIPFTFYVLSLESLPEL